MRDDEIGERRVAPERAQRRQRRGGVGEQRRGGAPSRRRRGAGAPDGRAIRVAPARPAASAAAGSARPPGGRTTRRTPISSARAAASKRRRRAAEARQPVAEQSGERDGGEVARRGERQPREHAGLAFRRAGGPAEVSTSIPQRASSAATRRATATSGVISAAVRPGVSSASRIAHGERQRLLVLVGGLDDRHAGERAVDRRFVSASSARSRRQASVEFGRPQRFAEEMRARGGARADVAERPHGVAADADDLQQPVENRLRMAGDADRVAVGVAEQRPGGVVEVAIEVGQHDGALRRARDRRDQPRGGAVGAGRAGDDRRPAPAPAASARISASIASAARRARSTRPRSASQSGQWAKAILRKSRVTPQ